MDKIFIMYSPMEMIAFTNRKLFHWNTDIDFGIVIIQIFGERDCMSLIICVPAARPLKLNAVNHLIFMYLYNYNLIVTLE